MRLICIDIAAAPPVNAIDPSGLELRYYRYPVPGTFGYNHIRIVLYNPVASCYVQYDGKGPGSVGLFGSVIAMGGGGKQRHPDPIGQTKPTPIKGQAPIIDGDPGTIVVTGLSFDKESAIFDKIYAHLKPLYWYSARVGPNSNTFAHQLMLLASKGGDFAMPPAPPGSSGWDYDGRYKYGGDCYDEWGEQTEAYTGLLWNQSLLYTNGGF